MICINCKEPITNNFHKRLWINNTKTKIIICQECYINFYIINDNMFKVNHYDIYKNEYDRLFNL